MSIKWKEVDWTALANTLKGLIYKTENGIITVRTEELANYIGKSNAPLGKVFWFSFIHLFDEELMIRPVIINPENKEIGMEIKIRPVSATWQGLYEFAIEIEKLKDFKLGIELLLEQYD